MSLDIIGIIYGTDKSYLRNDYLVHYERLFSDLKNEKFNLIEIGIQDGASLRMWQAYFSKATIVGIDISQNCVRHASGRIKVEVGSQGDANFLDAVVAKYPPTIIIDDGSHRADHQIFSFEHLFPSLLHGGCYVVEDLTSNERSRGESPIPSPDYFAQLLKGVMTRWESPLRGTPSWAPTTIATAYAAPGTIAFWKTAQIEIAADVEMIEDLVGRSGVPKAWAHFAWYLENRLGAFDHALRVARHGAEFEPMNPWMQLRIAQILKKMGNREAATDAARKAVELSPNEPIFRKFLDRLRAEAGG